MTEEFEIENDEIETMVELADDDVGFMLSEDGEPEDEENDDDLTDIDSAA